MERMYDVYRMLFGANSRIGFSGFICFVMLFCIAGGLWAEEMRKFEYRHRAGDRWHINSVVREEVLDGDFILYETEILNRISVSIISGDKDRGYLWNKYQIAERRENSDVFTWNKSFEVKYYRDRYGYSSDFPDDSLVPTVRNVPIYPEEAISIGSEWTGEGLEVFNLEPTYGIDEQLRIDFLVDYYYAGREVHKGKELDVVVVDYSYKWEPELFLLKRLQKYSNYPVQIIGEFHQELFWDAQAGRNYAEEGDFSYYYQMSNGQIFTFRGRTSGEAIYTEAMDREGLLKEIQELSEKQGGISAEANDEGVSLNIENIQFYPDSDRMMRGEEIKLNRILALLRRYPERDIMVVGHTAKIMGRGDGRVLSEKRAETVARVILNSGTREPYRLITRGMGNGNPIASNATSEGRRRNRRVEIIILEN